MVGWRAAEGADDSKVVVELSDASAAKNAKVVGTLDYQPKNHCSLLHDGRSTSTACTSFFFLPLSRSCEGRMSAELTSLSFTGAWRRRCGASAVSSAAVNTSPSASSVFRIGIWNRLPVNVAYRRGVCLRNQESRVWFLILCESLKL